jgi:DNA polymerase-1
MFGTKTLLVDSQYLLKRSYNGAKNEYTTNFGHIGGLYSFFTTIRMLLKEYRFNKIVLVWDGENGGIKRYVIDKSYKANRSDKSWSGRIELSDKEYQKELENKESILKQKKRIQAYAEELFIRQIEVFEIEADDLISAYCQQYYEKEEIYIFTNDRDFLQLLDYDINIIFGTLGKEKSVLINKNNFLLHFDFYYRNALPIKIICGDASDNIQGIKGLKEKTLINHFPDIKDKPITVKQILLEANRIQEERVSSKPKKDRLKALDNLLMGVNRLKINHQLVNLHEPLLNDEAIEELEQLEAPLDDTDRGSKNLIKMMNEDQFFYKYDGDVNNYLDPFYSVIMKEKENLKKYYNT